MAIILLFVYFVIMNWVFYLVVSIIISILISFQVILYRRWRKRLSPYRWWPLVSKIWFSLFIITQLPLATMLIIGRSNFTIAYENGLQLFYYIFTAWNYSFLGAFPIWLVATGILSLLAWLASREKPAAVPPAIEQKQKAQRDNLSRSQFLKNTLGASMIMADALPLAGFTFSLGGMFLGSSGFSVFHREKKIPGLHRDLVGLKIMQISDLHIGNLINEQYLKTAAELMRSEKADLLTVTGDIIDNNNYFIPTAAAFFQGLESSFPLGIYGILGNHDHIDNGDHFYNTLHTRGINLLRNDSIIVPRGKGKLNLAGLDYPMPLRRRSGVRMQKSKEFFDSIQPKIDPELPTIVMNHHPSDFEYLKKEAVDLVLSGHTHGGQFMFSQNRDSVLALAGNFYRYFIDMYEENGRSLYVNRGFGHWFPLRIGCPPEITVITLT